MEFVLIGASVHFDDYRMAPIDIDISSPMNVYWYCQYICKRCFSLPNCPHSKSRPPNCPWGHTAILPD